MFIQLLRSMRSRCLTLQRPLCRRTDSPLLWPPRVQGPQSKKPRLKSKKTFPFVPRSPSPPWYQPMVHRSLWLPWTSCLAQLGSAL